MKKVNYILMTALVSMLNFMGANAQGLSLSFNLTETDTLANMIAKSKKYDITSLTLSGYVNDVNTLYIQDLNQKGKLTSLDLSDVTYISAKGQNRTARYSERDYTIKDFFIEQQYPNAKDINRLPNYVNDTLVISDKYEEALVVRTFSGFRIGPWSDSPNYNCAVTLPFSSAVPKRIFDNCNFSKFVAPKQLESIGGADCSFRVNSCGEYVLGNKVHKIDDGAFLNSRIDNLSINSVIDTIGAHAFENCMGNSLLSTKAIANANTIGASAFKNSSWLKGIGEVINLPAKSIGNSSFQYAELPHGLIFQDVEELGDSAFASSTIGQIEFGEKVKSFPDSLFANCANLSIVIGGSHVDSIGNYAFYGCKKLKDFTPSAGLLAIGAYAFANDSLLESFEVPNTVVSIGTNTFDNSGLKELKLGLFPFRKDLVSNCDNLESIEVSNSNQDCQSKDGVVFTKDGDTIIFYPYGKSQSIYEIPDGVTEIADSAFYAVNRLGALGFPETIKTIGKDALRSSSILEIKSLASTTPTVTDNALGVDQSLVRLFVPKAAHSTYYIANYWGDFKHIYALEDAVSNTNDVINVAEAGTLAGYIGFGNQSKYSSLKLSGELNGDDIRYLREMAGRDVNGKETAGTLTDLDISMARIVKGGGNYYIKGNYYNDELSTEDDIIGESMFEGCNLSAISINENIEGIGSQALKGTKLSTFRLPAATTKFNINSFYGMNTLKEFIVDESNENWMSDDGALFTKDGKSLLLYPYGKEGERYTTPESVTTIGYMAFGGSNLKYVTTSEGLETIEQEAFSNLGSLEGIGLSSTLDKIGHRAFWGCNNLMDVSCKAYYPPTLEYDKFSYFGQPYDNFSDNTYENAVLLVPEENGGYKSWSGWRLFNNIIEDDSWITGLLDITPDVNSVNNAKYYNLKGMIYEAPVKGFNIIKMSDGTTKKVFVK